jgi:hypothetical protein
MARGDHQIKIRFPDALVADIRNSAKDNGRSMNAEVVARLTGRSFDETTLRDEFAGQALAGLLSSERATDEIQYAEDVAADRAYRMADAMLAARAALAKAGAA